MNEVYNGYKVYFESNGTPHREICEKIADDTIKLMETNGSTTHVASAILYSGAIVQGYLSMTSNLYFGGTDEMY